MSRFPSMPLFVDAYLGDTQHLTAEMHGAYLLLLMAMWRRNGWVPDDDRDLARICKCNPRRWPHIKRTLMPMLIVKDGLLSQKKLCRLFKGIVEFQRKAGKGGSLKSLNLPPRSDPQKCDSDRGVRLNENNDISPPITKTIYRRPFSAPFIHARGNGSAAIGPAPAVEGHAGPTPISEARAPLPEKEWPPPSRLLPLVYPNGKAAQPNGKTAKAKRTRKRKPA